MINRCILVSEKSWHKDLFNKLKKDFKKISDLRKKTSIDFSKLLKLVAESFPKLRIRFSTSNPQDMSLSVIKTMSNYENICNYIHLPVQSGSDKVLKAMNRQHTREEYLTLIKEIRKAHTLVSCHVKLNNLLSLGNFFLCRNAPGNN
mgnify:CR=1 FL=1